ncbi:glycosyltransferase family 4 protein [Novosphingobium malaysiense]|uniref:glycosyltransferase family 4 protein n=1 Tax=Novosphingobium malaysiense TaxID=1348853 RepID=UPI0018CF62AD|nr:glycosyltransferase family 4 protein [Novosphingobium malaysiense]
MTVETVGGCWHHAIHLAEALVRRGIDVNLAVLGTPPDAAQSQDLDALQGVKWTPICPPYGAVSDDDDRRAVGLRLARLANEEGCDLVQVHSPVLAALAKWSVPVVGLAHQSLCRSSPAFEDTNSARTHVAMQEGLDACDRVIVPSLSFAEELQQVFKIVSPVSVVRNGCPLQPMAAAKLAPFAFTAGRLWDEAKNCSLLDTVAAHLDFPFMAAGPREAPNKREIAVRHLEYRGNLSKGRLQAYLAHRPVFVSAALSAPYGHRVLEAAQAGCALVLSDIPIFRELWGGVAHFVEPCDAVGFVRSISELARQPELRIRFGLAARCRAADYSLKKMTDGMLDQYSAALSARQALQAA